MERAAIEVAAVVLTRLMGVENRLRRDPRWSEAKGERGSRCICSWAGI